MKPVLSIVIANYNYGCFLEDAILSIFSQDVGDRAEIIICDAASTDNSLDIINKYSDKIAWWCSEKDGGQSAAFNKGFSHARGTWFTWLNADDYYIPGTLRSFFDFIESHPKAEWVTGNKIHFDSTTNSVVQVNWGPHMMPPLLTKNHASSGSFGPTAFWHRSIYEKFGPIDESMHYAMDTEYWARLTMNGVKQFRLQHFCWAFRDHEMSKTAGVQSTSTTAKRTAETMYWRKKTGYTYIHGFSNFWWLLLMLWRIFDGSLAKKQVLRMKYEHKPISYMIKTCKECM